MFLPSRYGFLVMVTSLSISLHPIFTSTSSCACCECFLKKRRMNSWWTRSYLSPASLWSILSHPPHWLICKSIEDLNGFYLRYVLIPVKLICQGYLGGFRDSHSKSSSVDKAAINMLLTRLFLSGIRDDDGISFIIILHSSWLLFRFTFLKSNYIIFIFYCRIF